MLSPEPFMLVRARPHADARERFERWFLDTHMADARRIPGISQVAAARTAGGTRLGIYAFESTDVVQTALSSPEAAYTRGTWAEWTPHLDELTLEIFAPLFSMPSYRGPD
jgi:hypothetical protein